jgi:hypothetical protein
MFKTNIGRHDMIQGWTASQRFTTISFLVRNEGNHKQTVMEADLESGKGLTLKNGQGKPIMVIKLPNNDPTSLGKLMHPAPATLFKVGLTLLDLINPFRSSPLPRLLE